MQSGPMAVQCCQDPNAYCHFFEFDQPGPEGTCPPPSLCLPKPTSCGNLNEPCCPQGIASKPENYTCSAPELRCVGSHYNDTVAAYLDYAKDIERMPVESFGKCIFRE